MPFLSVGSASLLTAYRRGTNGPSNNNQLTLLFFWMEEGKILGQPKRCKTDEPYFSTVQYDVVLARFQQLS